MNLKRIISFTCVLAVMLMALSPLTALAIELPEQTFPNEKGEYAFFDFNDGEVIPMTVNETTTTDSTGRSFYPLRSGVAATAVREDITVDDGGVQRSVSVLTVTSPGDRTFLVFTDKDGKPFEVRENTKYTINFKAYAKVMGKYSQIFLGAGNYASGDADWSTTTASFDFTDATIDGETTTDVRNARYPFFGTSSKMYNTNGETETTGSPARVYDTFSTSNDKQYYNTTATFTVGEKENGKFYAHTEDGTPYEIDSYLGVYISGHKIWLASGGDPLGTSICFDSVEVFAETVEPTASYYDGDTLLATDSVAIGDSLRSDYPVEEKAFAGWYADKELTVKADTTIRSPFTVVYGKWLGKDYRINLTYKDGDNVIKSETTAINSKLWNGKNAVAGKYFCGWYTDKELTNAYSGFYAGIEDLTLYGKFRDCVTDVTINSWPTVYSNVNTYKLYNDTLLTQFDAGGYSYKPSYAPGKLADTNTNSYTQNSSTIIFDSETGDVLVPEPSATYEISISYTIPELDSKTARINLGYGMSCTLSSSLQGKAPTSYTRVATHTEATTEVQTASTVINIPDEADDVLPCLVIYTNLTSVDTDATSPYFSAIVIEEVTIKKVVVEGFNYGGASILTDRVANKYNTQALRIYYDYQLTENGKFQKGDQELSIVERGVLYKADGVSDTGLAVDNVGVGGVGAVSKNNNFDECWNFDSATGELTYSIYVADLEKNDTRRIGFRGYIVLEDNTVCYTDTRYVSVSDVANVKDITDVQGTQGKEKISIMLVIGQSNAQGAGYSEEKGIIESSGGLWKLSELPTTTEYGAVYMGRGGDAVTTLSPENEYSTNYVDVQGGFAPAYAARWYELTGERVVIIQVAVGATSLAEWQKDANTNEAHYKELDRTGSGYNSSSGYYLYSRAVEAYNETYNALKENYDISHSFYAWNQGENAERRTDPETQTIYDDDTYEQYFKKLHDDLMNDCEGMDFGTIIAVRSCRAESNSQGIVDSGTSTNARRAQYRVASKYDDIYMVSWLSEDSNRRTSFSEHITEEVWGGNWDLIPTYPDCSYNYSNMHFTQLNYNRMGKDAAENLYKSLYGGIEFNGVAVRDNDANLIGKFGTDGSGSFNIAYDGTIKYKFIQVRPESASCTYDFALSVDTASKQLVIDLYTDGSHFASGDQYVTEHGEINWEALAALGISDLDIVCNIH